MRTKKAIVPLSAVPTIARRIEAAFARKRTVMMNAPAESVASERLCLHRNGAASTTRLIRNRRASTIA
jgi:hypothetical protein